MPESPPPEAAPVSLSRALLAQRAFGSARESFEERAWRLLEERAAFQEAFILALLIDDRDKPGFADHVRDILTGPVGGVLGEMVSSRLRGQGSELPPLHLGRPCPGGCGGAAAPPPVPAVAAMWPQPPTPSPPFTPAPWPPMSPEQARAVIAKASQAAGAGLLPPAPVPAPVPVQPASGAPTAAAAPEAQREGAD